MNKDLLISENWDCEKAREILNSDGINATHLYMGANTLLIHVKDFDTMKVLFSDIPWFISKNEGYWDLCVSASREQFVFVDFKKDLHLDPLAMVAITFSGKKEQYGDASDVFNNSILNECYEYDEKVDAILTNIGVTKEYIKRLLGYA